MIPKCKQTYPYKREAGINVKKFCREGGGSVSTGAEWHIADFKDWRMGHEPKNVVLEQ